MHPERQVRARLLGSGGEVFWTGRLPQIQSDSSSRPGVAGGDRCPPNHTQLPGAGPLSPGALGAAFWARIRLWRPKLLAEPSRPVALSTPVGD